VEITTFRERRFGDGDYLPVWCPVGLYNVGDILGRADGEVNSLINYSEWWDRRVLFPDERF